MYINRVPCTNLFIHIYGRGKKKLMFQFKCTILGVQIFQTSLDWVPTHPCLIDRTTLGGFFIDFVESVEWVGENVYTKLTCFKEFLCVPLTGNVA